MFALLLKCPPDQREMLVQQNFKNAGDLCSMKVIDGWPCISESLQWTEECPLYLMGQYAALQVSLFRKSKPDVNPYQYTSFTDFPLPFFPLTGWTSCNKSSWRTGSQHAHHQEHHVPSAPGQQRAIRDEWREIKN